MLTVKQLIEELQAMPPALKVRILPTGELEGPSTTGKNVSINYCEHDWQQVDKVRNDGGHVTIVGY